jgi:hypothetical protein
LSVVRQGQDHLGVEGRLGAPVLESDVNLEVQASVDDVNSLSLNHLADIFKLALAAVHVFAAWFYLNVTF